MQGLDELIATVRDPSLRTTLTTMKECPVRTNTGCTGFVDFIVGSLVRHNCHKQLSIDDALATIYFNLMNPVNMSGKPKATLFGGFNEDRPFVPGTNPVQARFVTAVGNFVRSCSRSNRSLRTVERRPGVSLSISSGRRKENAPGTTISPDEIPAPRIGWEQAEREMLLDIEELLRFRQRQHPSLPIIDVFHGIVTGDVATTRVQRAKWGKEKTDMARKILIQTLEDYGRSIDNWLLVKKVEKLKNLDRTKPDPSRPRSKYRQKRVNPLAQLPPDVRDFISIISVIQAAGGGASMGLFGTKRRRWLERKARNPTSPHPTRLHDVLANMVTNRVLEKHGATYVLGPNAQKYIDLAGNVAPANV
jgi:hypothetical protein